jgi:ABC-type branched-subunit amino acid transport system substrate-binding protein
MNWVFTSGGSMSNQSEVREATRRSLASVALTSVAITVNHLYTLGRPALLLGAVLIALPTASLVWFRNTRSRLALVPYFLLNLWIVAGFGVYKGLWNGALRLFLGSFLASISTSYPKPAIGSYGFESSGILMFVGSLSVMYFGYQLFQNVRASVASRPSGTIPHRLLAVIPLLGALLIAAYTFAERDRFVPPANGVVTVGVIAPTTGPYAILGSSFVKAVEMAKSDLRGNRYRYELRIVDPGPLPANARAIVRRAIQENKLDAVVGAVSLIGEVTKPYATRARIPHLCVCTVASIGDGGYNFTNIPSPEAEAVRWVAEARRRGIRRIAVLAQDYPSINNHVKALKSEARRRGLGIVYQSRFADSVTDFRALIQRGQASEPDVYYVEALEPALDLLGRQLADAHVRNVASVVAPSLSRNMPLFEGVWYTDSDLTDMDFKRRFEQAYPGTQFATHMMPYAYDSFVLIARAYEQGVNPAAYLRALNRYDGTAGVVTKAPGSGNFQSIPAVWMIRSGRPVLLKQTRDLAGEEGL